MIGGSPDGVEKEWILLETGFAGYRNDPFSHEEHFVSQKGIDASQTGRETETKT